MKEYTLSNGMKLPAIGFGTYLSTDGRGEKVILDALEAGYRYLDTASFYHNEEEIGSALSKCGILREELFLVSKAWKTQLGYEKTRKAFLESLEKLGVDYLDIYLIHWPKETPDDENWKEKVQGSYRALEEFCGEGKLRAPGLSNFLPHHIMAIRETAKIEPVINQLELHAGYMQYAAVEYCRKEGIQVQAWSPLGRARVFKHKPIIRMAEKYHVTVAQLLLAFLHQQDIAIVPKASSIERMKENLVPADITMAEEDFYYLLTLPRLGWSGEHPDYEWLSPEFCE